MEVKIGYSAANKIGHLAEVLDGIIGDINRSQTSLKVRNQNLEELICALSHDLRTPLLATRNTLESMLKGAFGSVNDTCREVLAEHHQANEELISLVEVLLDISRYEADNRVSLNYQPLNWERLFIKVIAKIQAISGSNYFLNYQIGRSLPIIYGDELEMQRVLQNLLDNAVRVSEPNKQILLEVASFKDNQVTVSVRDQGIGIAPQEKEQLFHRFIQGRGRRGKSGLGLYLCRQIIEAHGGTIGVDSSLGLGSTFWFTLPDNTDKARFSYLHDWECRTRNYA
jgi:signal transduction histidine kinase